MARPLPKDPLVWIDCEMTGLDLSKDRLLEIAVRPRRSPLDEILAELGSRSSSLTET